VESKIVQLTRYTDYGLRVLTMLAVLPEGRLTSINEICGSFDLSRNHVNKIVHHLGKLGWASTKRGKGGGVGLGCPAEAINLAEVVRALESNLAIVECHSPVCELQPVCRLQGILAAAAKAFMDTLGQYTLADLVVAPEEITQVLKLMPLNVGQQASS
jgi:Rrf2 family nitric oxide-sensitive transcriptional repressor